MLVLNQKNYQESQKNITNSLKDMAAQHAIALSIRQIHTSRYKLLNIHKTEQHFKNIKPRFNLILETDTIENCYTLLGMVHQNYASIIGQFMDYISTPHNQYQNIRTSVFCQAWCYCQYTNTN